MELYFVRHGQTEYNRKNIVQGSGIDSSLNNVGEIQAQQFYSKYKEESFDAFYCSELKRSHETLKDFENDGFIIKRDARLNEISWGIFEGRPNSKDGKKVYQEMLNSWAAGDLDAKLEGGESARELMNRTKSFMHDLVQRNYKKILICTHGRTLRCLLTIMTSGDAADMESFQHANTGLFIIVYKNPGFIISCLNDTSHLVTS